jgi:hypothetical protein
LKRRRVCFRSFKAKIIVEENYEIIARILPFNSQMEEQLLVSQGIMTLPQKELTERFLEYGSTRNFDRKDY